MRLVLTLACPEPLPFDHLPLLKRAFHRWTGHNPRLHDAESLYSYSWLRDGRVQDGHLVFAQGQAEWAISVVDDFVGRQLLAGLVGEPELGQFGLVVRDARLVGTPAFAAGERRFELGSPVLVHDSRGVGHGRQLRYDDPATEPLLTATLQRKLRLAGLAAEGVRVRFAADEKRARTQMVRYKSINNFVNRCPVLITGSAEQLGFAWCVGVGHSTGIGFGALS